MGRVSVRQVNGKLLFVASYLGPGPSGTYGAWRPGAQLGKAIESTPGATVGERRHLGIAVHYGDEVDYEEESLLEITAANVAALLKSEFKWEDGALAAAQAVVDAITEPK